MRNKGTISSILEMNNLINYMRHEKKCVWLQSQNFDIILKELKSEINEVEKEIKSSNKEKLNDELLDVLWDILLLLSFAEDEKDFDISKQSKKQINKIKRRKPYLFGNERANTPEEASVIWNRVKKKEKENC